MAPAATPPASHFCSEGKLFGGHFGDPFSPLSNSLITGSAACNTSLPRQSPCLLWTSTDLPLAPVGLQCFTAASVPQAVMVAQPWSRHSNSELRVWRLGSVPASAAQPQRVHSMEAAEIVTPPPKPPLCLPASASSGRLRLPACGAGAGAAAVQVCNLTAGTERRHCCRPIPGTPWGLSRCRWRDPPPEAFAGGWMSGWMDGKMGRGRVRSILQQYKS